MAAAKALKDLAPQKSGTDVKLKNVGDALRVFIDTAGKQQVIKIGETKVVNLKDKTIERLKDAQTNGDTLHVISGAAPRVRIGKAGTEKPADKPVEKPDGSAILALLSHVDDFTEQEFLRQATKLLPKDTLPIRPNRTQIVKALGEEAKKRG